MIEIELSTSPSTLLPRSQQRRQELSTSPTTMLPSSLKQRRRSKVRSLRYSGVRGAVGNIGAGMGLSPFLGRSLRFSVDGCLGPGVLGFAFSLAFAFAFALAFAPPFGFGPGGSSRRGGARCSIGVNTGGVYPGYSICVYGMG